MKNGTDLLKREEEVIVTTPFYVRPGFEAEFLRINRQLGNLTNGYDYRRSPIPEKNPEEDGVVKGWLIYDVIEQWKNQAEKEKFLARPRSLGRELEKQLEYATLKPL